MKPSQFNNINDLIMSEYIINSILSTKKLAHKFNVESCIAQGETLLRQPLRPIKFNDAFNHMSHTMLEITSEQYKIAKL